MPLFNRKSQEVVPPPQPAPVEHRGLFSHRHSTSVSPTDYDRRTSDRSSMLSKSSSTSKPGLFHRNHEDPSISAARQRVVAAENAERDADRALAQARVSVREAKEHARRLELEAKEDARLAKIKEEQAGKIGKRARPLGRECLQAPTLIYTDDHRPWCMSVRRLRRVRGVYGSGII